MIASLNLDCDAANDDEIGSRSSQELHDFEEFNVLSV